MRIVLWNFLRFFGVDNIDTESNTTGGKSKARWVFKCKGLHTYMTLQSKYWLTFRLLQLYLYLMLYRI